MKPRRRPVSRGVLLLLLPVVLVAGIWLGGHPDALPGFVRSALVGDTEGRLFDEALDVLEEDYYRQVDRRRLLNEGLDAAVESLDDQFSDYFDPRAYNDFQASTSGEFEGVGMVVEEVPQGLRVMRVYEGSPAARGGLAPGAVITAVDGRSIAGTSSEEATDRIKGEAGTEVRLTVRTPDGRRVLELRRARVEIPVVQAEMVRAQGREIAHVSLASFTSGAHGEVAGAVRRLLREGADGVVLDLRNNGGGLLNEAVLVSSVFIEEGPIVSTRGRSRPSRTYEAAGGAIDPDIPLAVLVNNQSASASEIVAGAMQDRDRGRVVGENTFGKGVFQEIRQLPNGGALDITVGSYFTPDGRNLGGGGVREGDGITPDLRAVDDPDTRRDEALEAAAAAAARGGV